MDPMRSARHGWEVQVSYANTGKHPPQFVFDMIVAQMSRAFLHEEASAEDLAKVTADKFAALYDVEGLETDIVSGIERFMAFIDSVQISDVDLILSSFVWFVANYEDLTTARKKKTMFGSPLKGKPKQPNRAFNAASLFKTYTYAVGSRKAPVRPPEWKPEDETEFQSVFSLLYPQGETASAQAS
jgi:hypothetical protein